MPHPAAALLSTEDRALLDELVTLQRRALLDAPADRIVREASAFAVTDRPAPLSLCMAVRRAILRHAGYVPRGTLDLAHRLLRA